MELSEILKFDCLTEIIKKLAVWKSLSLLNEDIEVTNKFIRGLNWLNKLKGNAILYLIKDSQSLEIISDRFFINQKEKRYLKDFLEVKKYLQKHEKEIHQFTPSEWTEFIEGRNLDPETVKLIISDGVIFWRFFLRWLIIYRYIKSKKNGKILKEEGWKAGKKMGEELKRLRYVEIDNYKKN